MGLLLSRVRSDPYYASYEKRFEKLDAECKRLQGQLQQLQQINHHITGYYLLVAVALTVLAALHAAWVYQQPAGTFEWDEHLLRTSPVVVLPLLLWLGHEIMLAFFKWKTNMRKNRLTRLLDRKRKLIKEVKDMTRYDKVSEFLRKWDPDVAPPTPMQKPAGMPPPGALQPAARVNSTPELLYRLTGGAASVAVGAATGAGKSLLPLLDKVAQNVVGDSPMLVNDIRRLQQQLQAAEARAHQLTHENRTLKQHNAALLTCLQQLDVQPPEPLPLSPIDAPLSQLDFSHRTSGAFSTSSSAESANIDPASRHAPGDSTPLHHGSAHNLADGSAPRRFRSLDLPRLEGTDSPQPMPTALCQHPLEPSQSVTLSQATSQVNGVDGNPDVPTPRLALPPKPVSALSTQGSRASSPVDSPSMDGVGQEVVEHGDGDVRAVKQTCNNEVGGVGLRESTISEATPVG